MLRTKQTIVENSGETRAATRKGGDAELIRVCNEGIALLKRVQRWNQKSEPWPGDHEAWVSTQQPAWKLTRKAMKAEVHTLPGVRAQAELLLLHHEYQGNRPEKPEIELPVLHNILRLLPAD